jgi:hypothetical protein
MSTRDELIDALGAELAPVRPRNSDIGAMLWLLLATASVLGLVYFTGPFRPGFMGQLLAHPRFAIETGAGVVAIVLVALAAGRCSVPGALTPRLATVALASAATWVSFYIYGLFDPALEPSMVGKRDHCVFETFLYGAPAAFAAWLLIRQQFTLRPLGAAFLGGLAAGMIPALYMQLACMYEPLHILVFHIAPGVALALVTLAAVALSLRRDCR